MSTSTQRRQAPTAEVVGMGDQPMYLDFANAALAYAPLGKMGAAPENPSAVDRILPLDCGLYTIEIGVNTGSPGEVGGVQLPVLHFSTPNQGKDQRLEIIGASGVGEIWVGPE